VSKSDAEPSWQTVVGTRHGLEAQRNSHTEAQGHRDNMNEFSLPYSPHAPSSGAASMSGGSNATGCARRAHERCGSHSRIPHPRMLPASACGPPDGARV